MTDAERAAFRRWLAADPDNQAEFDLIEHTRRLAPSLKHDPAIRAYLDEIPAQAPARRVQGSWILGTAAAACLLFLLAPSLVPQTPIYESGAMQQRQLSLADGSTIWLNTNSRLRVVYGGDTRRILLLGGQAFFDVAHDPRRPFVVEAGSRRVTVTGTRFDVRYEHASVEVAVEQGHVVVENLRRPDRDVAGAGAMARLSAGDVLSVPGTAERLPMPEQRASVLSKTSWRGGRIYLDNASLAAAVDEINRYTTTKLELGDADIARLRLSAVLRTGDIDGFLFTLKELHGVTATRTGDRIVLGKD